MAECIDCGAETTGAVCRHCGEPMCDECANEGTGDEIGCCWECWYKHHDPRTWDGLDLPPGWTAPDDGWLQQDRPDGYAVVRADEEDPDYVVGYVAVRVKLERREQVAELVRRLDATVILPDGWEIASLRKLHPEGVDALGCVDKIGNKWTASTSEWYMKVTGLPIPDDATMEDAIAAVEKRLAKLREAAPGGDDA